MQLSPWPWYVVGPLIALTMAALLLSGRRFGISSNLRTMCTVAGAGSLSEYFRLDWRAQRWNLVFVLGTVCGGAISRFVLLAPDPVALNPATVASLQAQGITDAGAAFAPAALFGPEAWSNPLSVLTLLLGGLLVGFGTRWANGCTSGHAISGLSSLQWPSLIAAIGFFIGGLTVTHFVLPHWLPIL
jgi:uncharacterized membrane protein YedE/YeeE